MKPPLLKLFMKVFISALLINLLGAGFASANIGLLGHRSYTGNAPSLIEHLGILTLQTVISIAFVGLSGGLLLWLWAWQVVWTPARKAISWAFVALAIVLPGISMLMDSWYVSLPVLLLPLGLIWAWSPSKTETLHLVKESETGPKLCLLTRHTAALLQSLLLGLPVVAVIFGLNIFSKIQFADTENQLPIKYLSAMAGSLICVVSWTAVWWPFINKSKRTIALSIIALLAAGNVEIIFFRIVQNDKSDDILLYISGFALAIIYMALTLFIWRTSRLRQRRQLLDSPQYAEFNATPYCVECGFNMTGLKKLRCPECGQEYTLAELIFENVRIRDLDMQLDPLPFKDITATG